MTDWYATALLEIKSFLDDLGEDGYIGVYPEDDIVAAMIAMLQAGQIIYAAGQHAYRVAEILHELEVV